MQKVLAQRYIALLTPFLVFLSFSFFESAFLFQFGLMYPVISLLFCFVFYFSVFNPAKLNLVFVFLLGIFSDFFMAYPLGFQSFALLIGSFLAGFNRRIIVHLSFQKQWFIFMLILLGVYLINLLFLRIFLERTISLFDFIIGFTFISLMYPFLAKFAAVINQKTGVL